MSPNPAAMKRIESIELNEKSRADILGAQIFGVLTVMALMAVFLSEVFWFWFVIALVISLGYLCSRNDDKGQTKKDLVRLRKIFGEPSVTGFIDLLRSPVT